jgi:hypothetical protein
MKMEPDALKTKNVKNTRVADPYQDPDPANILDPYPE